MNTASDIYSYYASHYNSLFESADDMETSPAVDINDSVDLYSQEYIYLFVHAIATTHKIKFKFLDPAGEDPEDISEMVIKCESSADATKLNALLNDEYDVLINLKPDEQEDYMDAVSNIFSKRVKKIEAVDNTVVIHVV